MKEKDIEGGQLEKLSSELFGSFDPDDESLIGGGSNITKTVSGTYAPSGGADVIFDLDDWYEE